MARFSIFGALVLVLLITNSCATNTTPAQRELLSPSSGNSERPSSDTDEGENSTFTFDWPVNEARLTRGFMPNKRRPHLGIDLAAPRGTHILASHDGMVIYAGRDFRGFGKMILLESGYGWATIYAHLDKITAREGQLLKQGDLVGLMGRTGRATGVHLHFEIRKNKGPVDPLPLLPNGEKAARQISKSN